MLRKTDVLTTQSGDIQPKELITPEDSKQSNLTTSEDITNLESIKKPLPISYDSKKELPSNIQEDTIFSELLTQGKRKDNHPIPALESKASENKQLTILHDSKKELPLNIQKDMISSELLTQNKLISSHSGVSIFSGRLKIHEGTKPVIFKSVMLNDKENMDAMIEEATTMKTLQSKRTVKYRGVSSDKETFSIIINDYFETLEIFLKKRMPISKRLKTEFAQEISYALREIHRLGYIHGNLKSSTIFMEHYADPKIGGFGSTKRIGEYKTPVGTPQWMAPELLFKNLPPTTASDIYSLGTIFWEIITGKTPFENIDDGVAVYVHRLKNPHEIIPEGKYPPIFKSLITACWDDDPTKRPSIEFICDQLDLAFEELTTSVPALLSASKASENKPVKGMLRDTNQEDVKRVSSPLASFSVESSLIKEKLPLSYSSSEKLPSEYKKLISDSTLENPPIEECEDIKPIYKQSLSTTEQALPSELHPYVIDKSHLIADFRMCSNTMIGHGVQGDVLKAELKTSQGQQIVAVKINRNRDEFKNIITEALMMQKLQSPYTIKFFGILECEENIFCIIMPLYPATLSTSLKESPLIPLTQKIRFILDIALGLNQLHEQGYIHCDIKCSNLLLNKNGKIKIADFGLTQSLKGQKKVGSPAYQPPEFFLYEKIYNTKQSDIYSFGVVMWEILTQKTPSFNKMELCQLWAAKQNRKHEILPEDCPLLLKDLISECWNDDPNKRPSAKTIADTLFAALKNPTNLEKTSIYSFGFFKKKKVPTIDIHKEKAASRKYGIY